MRCGFLTTGHTNTTHGPIPHILVGGGELRAPVKLQLTPGARRTARNGELVYPPQIRNGRYVHALPGGGEILGSVIAQAARGAK